MEKIREFIQQNPKISALYLIWVGFQVFFWASGRGESSFAPLSALFDNPHHWYYSYGYEEFVFYSIVPVLGYFAYVLFTFKKK